MKEQLRQLPPVHELQRDSRFNEMQAEFGLDSERLTAFLRQEIDRLRHRVLNGELQAGREELNLTDRVFTQARTAIKDWQGDRLKRVINGTGTVLHTNLGRSRLSEQATARALQAARSYSNLEYRIEEGKRGSRHDIIEDLLIETTGAEAAMVVNNNAAAVFLVLSAFAKNREVIVSRGELVEIGGSFRVSSIMEESGAQLVEIGTTNKTHLHDYERAIAEETAMILKVHTSNFKIIGFTETVATAELAELSRQHEHMLFYEDLGSGALFDFKKFGVGDEPVVRDVLKAGADIVSFSGDKLLGGPQAGIIAGKKKWIDRLKKHQLARVIRTDKMTLAALEETLKTYAAGEAAAMELPTVRDITRPLDGIRQQAAEFIETVQKKCPSYRLALTESTSAIGGGTMPGVEIPTATAAVSHPALTAEALARRLRNGSPAIITRIQDERVHVDFRTVEAGEMAELIAGFTAVYESIGKEQQKTNELEE
ncbi:L-seryl-tRNA(Sec) selenium transferase [Planococcus lenghuensis]|uniref:L-seryl-tRNA(Sec) selenium transferase n=1 Tax=Planococcus lenghuensis TaxID=2213202 RepID=A0A1Q2KZ73_9BACL|nr:L-seryl-tRNA(Sec) selenium transferase [Planococcus lenghuensis]AQQ53436.1 L-seryl-tRNA(Sec) selenium transferase [Planococcus lenghuensis]